MSRRPERSERSNPVGKVWGERLLRFARNDGGFARNDKREFACFLNSWVLAGPKGTGAQFGMPWTPVPQYLRTSTETLFKPAFLP